MVELNRKEMPQLAWGSSLPAVNLLREELTNGDKLTLLAGGEGSAVMLLVYFPLGEGAGAGRIVASGAFDVLLRGTAMRSDAELSECFDTLGTQVQSFATKDYGGLQMLSTEVAFRESLELLLESLTVPAYAEQSFLSWRGRTSVGLEVAAQTPSYVAQRALWSAMLGEPHRYQTYAMPENVAEMERGALEQYYRESIAGCCCHVLACGPACGEWQQVLREEFCKRESGRETPLASAPLVPSCGRRTEIGESVQRRQASVQLGCILPQAGHAGDVDLAILVSLLGGYMGSRLMQKLREEKGYTYGVSATASYFLDGGVLQVSSEVGNNYVAECVKDIKGEFARLRDSLAGAEELDRLRSYLHGRLLRSRDGVYATLAGLRVYVLNAGYGVDYPDRYAAALHSITAERLRAAAAEWLVEERFTLSVAGDAAEFSEVRW